MPRRFFSDFRSDLELGWKYALGQKWLDIRYPFRRLYRYVRKLVIYGRYLWNDYDFDHTYIFEIIKLKLELMSKEFDKNGMTVSAGRHANEMRRCIALCDRIIKDEYTDYGYDQLDQKYGKLVMETHPIEGETRCVELDIHRDAPKDSPEYEAERKESKKIMENAERQRKADIDYLFSYMAKHIQGWWD